MTNRIKELREQQGWSQAELAQRVGTTQQQIQRLEKSTRRLNEDWIRKLASVFECHPADLLSDPAVPAHTPREEALIERFRGLSDEQQEWIYKTVDALAPQQGRNPDKEESR